MREHLIEGKRTPIVWVCIIYSTTTEFPFEVHVITIAVLLLDRLLNKLEHGLVKKKYEKPTSMPFKQV